MASKKTLQKTKGLSVLDEQTLRLMFDDHSVNMLLIEPETGEILDANRAALDFYGYSKTEICSMSIGEINTLSPELMKEEHQKALNEGRNYFYFSTQAGGWGRAHCGGTFISHHIAGKATPFFHYS